MESVKDSKPLLGCFIKSHIALIWTVNCLCSHPIASNEMLQQTLRIKQSSFLSNFFLKKKNLSYTMGWIKLRFDFATIRNHNFFPNTSLVTYTDYFPSAKTPSSKALSLCQARYHSLQSTAAVSKKNKWHGPWLTDSRRVHTFCPAQASYINGWCCQLWQCQSSAGKQR